MLKSSCFPTNASSNMNMAMLYLMWISKAEDTFTYLSIASRMDKKVASKWCSMLFGCCLLYTFASQLCVCVFPYLSSMLIFFQVFCLCSRSLESCNEMFVHGIKLPWWPRHGHPDSIGWPSTRIESSWMLRSKKRKVYSRDVENCQG